MLRVHFLNVGHGDCTVIEHPSGRITMVDINNSQDFDTESYQEFFAEWSSRGRFRAQPGALGFGYNPLDGALARVFAEQAQARVDARQELTDPADFMRRRYPGRRVFRFILTHPDLDHMRGLKRLYEEIGIVNFWDTAHCKAITDFRSDTDSDDWDFYQMLRAGRVAALPARQYHCGDAVFAFGRDEFGRPGGDSMEILSPTRELVRQCNGSESWNDLSYVLRLRHAGRSVLLCGDAEAAAWDSMIADHRPHLKCDFLKASHHGRDSGYDDLAVGLMQPTMTFVSVGRKPATDASRKYAKHCHQVASTRYYGDIELEIRDNGAWEWRVQRNAGR